MFALCVTKKFNTMNLSNIMLTILPHHILQAQPDMDYSFPIMLILLLVILYPIFWGIKGIKKVNAGNISITSKWLIQLPVLLLIYGVISSLCGALIEPDIPKDDLALYLDNSGVWGGIANEALNYFSPAQIDYINKVNLCNKLGWLSLVIIPILFIVQALGLFKNMFGRVYIQGAAILTTLLTLITFFSFTSAIDAMMNNTATMRAISIISPNSSSFDIQGLFMGLLYFGFMHFAFHKCLNKVYGILTRENYNDYMQSPFVKSTLKSSDHSHTKKCPYCGGTIQSVAKKCIHCGQWLDNSIDNNVTESQTKHEDSINQNSISSKKSIKYLLISIVTVILVGIGIYVYNMEDEYIEFYDEMSVSDIGIPENVDGITSATTKGQIPEGDKVFHSIYYWPYTCEADKRNIVCQNESFITINESQKEIKLMVRTSKGEWQTNVYRIENKSIDNNKNYHYNVKDKLDREWTVAVFDDSYINVYNSSIGVDNYIFPEAIKVK